MAKQKIFSQHNYGMTITTQLTLEDKKTPFPLAGKEVNAQVKFPDKTSLLFPCTIISVDNGVIVLTITTEMTTQIGVHFISYVIEDETSLITANETDNYYVMASDSDVPVYVPTTYDLNLEINNAREIEVLIPKVDTTIADINSLSNAKVDKVVGKALSTNDYDDIEKSEVAKVKNKADTTYVDTKVNSVASGAPQPFATLAAIQAAYPTGKNTPCLNVADGKWYWWNGSAWTPGATYQGLGILERSITTGHTDFFTNSKNKFNKATITSGQNLVYTTGLLSANASYGVSDYIFVTGSTAYALKWGYAICYYDANKAFISGAASAGGAPITFTTPANCVYVRIAILLTNLNTQQLELGSTQTSYSAYSVYIPNTMVEKPVFVGADFPFGAIDKHHTAFFYRSKNMFDKTTAMINYNLVKATGDITPSTGNAVSDFMPTLPNTQISRTYDMTICYYDANKVFISAAGNLGENLLTRVTPSNCYYIKCATTTSTLDLFQVEQSSSPTTYEAYYNYIPLKYQEKQILSTDAIDNNAFRLMASRSNVTYNPHYRKWNPKYRDTFSDLSRWTATGCTITDDSQYCSIMGYDKRENGQYVKTTGHSIKLAKTTTTGTTCEMVTTLSQPIDLSAAHPLFRYYVHEGAVGDTYYKNLYAIYVELFDANNNLAVYADDGVTNAETGSNFRKGWVLRPWSIASVTKYGGVNMAAITKIKIVLESKTAVQTPAVTLDFLDFIPKLNLPIPYVWTADGGYTNQKPALAYLASRGIRCHLYVTYDKIGSAGYMTVDDLRDAEHMGHFIDCHERGNGKTGWLSLTQAEKEQSLQESFIWRAQNGFTASNGFCPLGAQWYSEEDITYTLNQYLEHIRIGTEDFCIPFNPRVLGLYYDTNFLTVADEAIKRQRAIDNGTYYIGLLHGLTTGGFTLEDFKTIVDNAIADEAAGKVKFVTIPELINTNWYAQ